MDDKGATNEQYHPIYSPVYTPSYQATATPAPAVFEIPRAADNDDELYDDQYFNTEFEACFKEHKSTTTIVEVYKIFGYIYKYTKLIMYNFLVIVFGVPLAISWGLLFGSMVFFYSWVWLPSLKFCFLILGAVQPAIVEPLRALLSPLTDIHARIFRQIRIKATIDGGIFGKTQAQTV